MVENTETPTPVMMERADLGIDLSGVDINNAPAMTKGADPLVATPSAESSPEAPVVAASASSPETILGTDTNSSTPAEAPEAPKVENNNEGGQTEQAPPPESTTEVAETVVEAPKEVAFDPWTLPEGVSLEESKITEFSELLKGLELEGKADHAMLQAFGQKAVDLYINEVTKTVEDLTKGYQTAWTKQVNDWKEDFLKDPVLGGNRFQSTVDAANAFIRTHGGSPEEQTEFRSLMESSGLGNNKTMIRILANAGRAMQEGTPLAASQPAPAPQRSKVETMYGKNR